MSRPISLVVFDADDTLWQGLDGGYISGKTYQEPGEDHYTFTRAGEDLIVRSDGQRFRLFSEARETLQGLADRGILISMASYNCSSPVWRALAALGLDRFFRHPVVEWSSRKDRMLQTIIERFNQDGWAVGPENTLFIDDDRSGIYRLQMARIGVAFLQKDVDILDLRQLLNHPDYPLVSL